MEQTTTYLSSYDKPSLVLGNAILLDGKVELLFLNDSIIVPDSIYQTGQYYSWTNLTNFIAVASKQEPFVLNATSTLSKETELEIPGFGTVIIPFGNTYLIPSESALQEFALLNCNGAERRILDFHTLSNQTYFANSFTNTTANFTESIKVVAVNGSVLFQGPYNSAKVVQADILVEGGVGHVVDAVLLPFASCSI